VRLNWTLDEFYADGGTTTFTDRVAATLGIPAWRIKTVAVYEGSVIVIFDILYDLAVEDPVQEIKKVGEKLIDKLSNAKDAILGAPLLDLDVDGNSIVRSTDYSDGNKGTSTLIADWLAERDANNQQTDEDTSDNTDGSSSDATDGGEDNSSTDGSSEDDGDDSDQVSVIHNNVTITQETEVEIQSVSIDNSDGESNFVIIILIIIVVVILIIAGFFIARLLLQRRKKKVILEEVEA